MTTEESQKTTLRMLLDDVKEFPATMVLGGAWVVVFALMVANRLLTGPMPSIQEVLVGNIGGAHYFGDMTLNEIFRGEVWRVVTCTFVHYNVLHIGMNLYGLYHLGTLVESWYGAGQFFAIYLVIGGGGNLVSALLRRARGMEPLMHSGGGSTVVLGLVGLCAVVGWRARSRIGDYLRGQMVGILLFTGFLGQVLPIIDNWGHAGGAMVGALVGFTHRVLIRTATRSVARYAGVVAAVLLIGSGLAQCRDNQVEGGYQARLVGEEGRLRELQRLNVELPKLRGFYPLITTRAAFEHSSVVDNSVLLAHRKLSRWSPARSPGLVNVPLAYLQAQQMNVPLAYVQAEQTRFLDLLDSAAPILSSAPTEVDFQRVRDRLAIALKQPPTAIANLEFQFHLSVLIRRATQDLLAAQLRRSMLARQAGID